MLTLLLALLLPGVMVLLGRLPQGWDLAEPARLSLAFGFLLMEAQLVGALFARVRLPRISGYLVAGAVCGPWVLGLVDAELALRMRFIDDLALTFIALTAGAELRLAALVRRKRSILSVGTCLLVAVPLVIGAVFVLARPWLPFARELGATETLVAGALVAVIALARSPTSAIAVINDCRAAGPFTDTVFGVTVAMDSLVILLFAVAVAFGEAAVGATGSVDLGFVATVAGQVAASVLLGALVGKAVAFYIRRLERDLSVLLVVLAFFLAEASRWLAHALDANLGVAFHLEPLLIAIAAGFTVQNFTGEGDRLNRALHAISLPIFVVFFAVAGVVLDLGALAAAWAAALAFAGARMGAASAAGHLGGRLAGEGVAFRRLAGFAFYTQAGVSLGLAQEVARRFPEWGGSAAAFLVACITLNELVGPVAFKFALDRMGESGKFRKLSDA